MTTRLKLETLRQSLAAYAEEMSDLARSPETIKNNRASVGGFIGVIDPNDVLLTAKVGEQHVRKWLRTLNVAPNSKRKYLSDVKRFLNWCVETSRLAANEAKRLEVVKRESERNFARLPSGQFDALLDATEHPRDRIGVTLGLYTLLRARDLVDLRIGEVDRDKGTVRKYLSKMKRTHEIGISLDLDEELERWYEWYRADLNVTEFDPQWPIIPPLRRVPLAGKGMNDPGYVLRVQQYRKDGSRAILRPDTYTKQVVQPALTKVGVPMRFTDHEGVDRAANEGAHSLRRSGARALYETLVAQGGEKTEALFLVQALLDHGDVGITARYIGVALQRDEVNRIIRGSRMFRAAGEDANIVRLQQRRQRHTAG